MAGYVLYELKGAVAYITLNRPERMNALGHDLRRELIDAFSTVRHDPAVRVAVITGAGNRAFSAGGDLKEHKEIFERKRVRVGPDYGALDEPPNSSTLALETYKPTIAAVNGYALAGGCELALACDIRIASENASFALTEVTVGRGANFGSVMLQYLVPRGLAMQMLLTGDRISAQEALRVGLVNRVVPSSELLSTAGALAEQIAINAPSVVATDQRTGDQVCGESTLFCSQDGSRPKPV